MLYFGLNLLHSMSDMKILLFVYLLLLNLNILKNLKTELFWTQVSLMYEIAIEEGQT